MSKKRETCKGMKYLPDIIQGWAVSVWVDVFPEGVDAYGSPVRTLEWMLRDLHSQLLEEDEESRETTARHIEDVEYAMNQRDFDKARSQFRKWCQENAGKGNGCFQSPSRKHSFMRGSTWELRDKHDHPLALVSTDGQAFMF